MGKKHSSVSEYDHIETAMIDDETPGFFRRNWNGFKNYLTSDVVPFLKKYWFEVTLTALLLAFTIALIVMIQLYPVLILGIAFITIGNAMPFAFLGSMSVGAATASITAIVLGVGALKIAVLSAIKSGISIFASWCWDKYKQEGNPVDPSLLDDLSEVDSGPDNNQPPVFDLDQNAVPVPPSIGNDQPSNSMILSEVGNLSHDDESQNQPQQEFFAKNNNIVFFSSASDSDSEENRISHTNDKVPLLTEDAPEPVDSKSATETPSKSSSCNIM